ncbi:TetR family transcriptional regulator [Streptomyces canus]|uniref:TetR family transcriptional regulator n=1 Tax=Streptomyces canus TaxID=58343 RepID=A0A101S4U6_9ACTN|nr:MULTISPECIES: TetR/AcrR family transcriptional regulator [Streptomyces]KUN67292.1 TetR family transcriptional regulator [Streptomyces canus]MDI5910851.1 TetR/AcrR family transcriptional regulator [Streptomyces sp. 12257]
MSTSTRRARERANTRERIIEAALHVLETEGVAALTIRRIATDVEYSAPVVYQHFANKDALVLELVAHGHRLMLTEFRRAAQEPDTDRRMTCIASQYVRFAGEHPHLFQVMNDPMVDADERRRVAEPVIDVLKELLTTWSAAHDVVLADFDQACEILWGTLYGIASLSYLGSVGNDRARYLAEQALRTILLGWRTETPANGRPASS